MKTSLSAVLYRTSGFKMLRLQMRSLSWRSLSSLFLILSGFPLTSMQVTNFTSHLHGWSLPVLDMPDNIHSWPGQYWIYLLGGIFGLCGFLYESWPFNIGRVYGWLQSKIPFVVRLDELHQFLAFILIIPVGIFPYLQILGGGSHS